MSEEQLVLPPAEQSAPSVGAGRGGSNTRALVVAGLTVLATVLVAGQAFTAYTVYQHSEKLSMLERRSVRLQEMSVRATVNRTPMKMSMPMSSFPLLMPLDAKEPETTSAPPKAPMTQCQQAAAGLIPSFLPSYRPQCDELGAYKPEQCWKEAVKCWCVDKDGSPLPGTMVDGPAKCNTAKE